MTAGGTATALARAIRSGETTAARAVEEALARIAAVEGEGLHAFLSVRAEGARRDAAAVDRRVEAGEAPPLAGVPVVVKD